MDRYKAKDQRGERVSSILVTGGSGFIGSALVKALVRDGHSVRVLDDNSRGSLRRLKEVEKDIEFVTGDIRDPAVVNRVVRGVDEVHHLAFVNGTEFFYSAPELVLDVGVKGMINVIDACRAQNVGSLILASSSEVYQTPPLVPTDERVPLLVPDPSNPRYSYGGGKIISELMAINYGRKFFERVIIFRPHNVYGPDMGWEHVIPQFALRIKTAAAGRGERIQFRLQGDGSQTRSFCHVDDLVAGVMTMRATGDHLGIYHVGTREEVAIAELARRVASHAGHDIELVEEPAPAGGTHRRCPDISKLERLGYRPQVPLSRGLPPTLDWYWAHSHLAPKF
jgi:nucleoside-diphosphate-sugar epimerase